MQDCPPRETLELLLAEKLDDDTRTLIEEHVEECEDCQHWLGDLTRQVPAQGSSALFSIQPKRSGDPSEPETEAFFERLKRMNVPRGTDPEDLSESDKDLPDVEGYEIHKEIGRGATGVVYRARHRKLNRLVALKLIVAGPRLSPAVRQRFQLEARAVARLRHANIVQIYDVSQHGELPYLSLELIAGGNLADWMDGKPRLAFEAAQIVATLADAIEYAHRQGVVHRDLKPSNVLVGEAPDRPGQRELKITDFGIAKVLPRGGDSAAQMTQTGEILGTPAYMAPEQARGNTSQITPAVDVYSIGAILYELLTGRPPFQGATALDTLIQVTRRDPVPIRLLVHRVPRDLETICLKRLEKEAGKRYRTAGDLAADIGRFLNNEPILARPVSWFEQGVRWTRRHRAVAASLLGTALSLVLLAVVSLAAMVHFRTMGRQQHALAVDKGRLADEKEIERGKAVAARQVAERQAQELRRDLYISQMKGGGQGALAPGGISHVHALLTRWENDPPDLRDWEWFYLNGLCHRDQCTLQAHLSNVLCVAWSSDGQDLAVVGSDGVVAMWEMNDRRELGRHRAGHDLLNSIAWSPDGQRLATAGHDRRLTGWKTSSGEILMTLQANAILHALAWSPNGKMLAAADHTGAIQVWNADTGARIHDLRGHDGAVFGVAWSPDSASVASAGQDRTVRLWDPVTGKQRKVLLGHQNWVRAIAWNRSGSRLASASNDQTVKIWDPGADKELQTLGGYTQPVTSVAWSPDGTRIATGSDDKTLRIWRLDTSTPLYAFRGHTSPITWVAWSPDGTRLASCSDDPTIKVWDTAAGPEFVTLDGGHGPIPVIAWGRDSRHLTSLSFDDTVTVWDVRNPGKPLVVQGDSANERCAAWSPDGRRLASAEMGRIRVRDAADVKKTRNLLEAPARVNVLAWSPDSRRLVSGGDNHSILIWDANTGTKLQSCKGKDIPVSSAAWSPDGRQIATGFSDGTVKTWDAATGIATVTVRDHTDEIKAVAWSPDGQRLAAASVDTVISLYSTTSGKLLLTLRGHTARVMDVAWNPSGTRLASASDDNTIRIWDALTGMETLTLDGGRHMNEVVWSPDGLRLASCGGSTILVHDATAGYAASLTEPYLAVLDRRIAADPNDSPDWRTKAEIHAGMSDWTSAEADLRQYLSLKPDEHWCALGFWVVGPFPENLNAHFPPEINPDPAKHVLAAQIGESAPAFRNWQRVPPSPTGCIDLGALFDNAEHISAYALLKIYCLKEQKVAILVGADDQVRLWLNDRQIHENLSTGAAVPDRDAVAAMLTPGWNTLLARVVNVTGAHVLFVRLSDTPPDLAKTSSGKLGK